MKLLLVRLSRADNPQIDRWVKVFSDGSPIAEIFESTDLDRAVRAPWTGDPFIIAGTPKDLDLWLNSLDTLTDQIIRDCAYWWTLTSSSIYAHRSVSQDRPAVLNWHDNQQNIIHEALEVLGRFPDLLGLSNGLHVLRQNILRIAEDRTGPSASVAILGDSGSGKELVAHALFGASHRASDPPGLLCLGGAWLNISPALAFTELLGVEPGIATEVAGRPGLLESYSTGALMFDDFESAPKNVQEVLLRIMATPRGQFAQVSPNGWSDRTNDKRVAYFCNQL